MSGSIDKLTVPALLAPESQGNTALAVAFKVFQD